MKKQIFLYILALTSVTFLGCSNKSEYIYTHQNDISSDTYKESSRDDIKNIIKEAAEDDGWSVDEYKSNALKAKKNEKPVPRAVTITFTKYSFRISSEDGSEYKDLEKAIADALK